MPRAVLQDRRPNRTLRIPYVSDGGREILILVTIGYDEHGAAKEVFCADFKAGTSIHAIVMDACILLSRLLQHGDEPEDLAQSMCQPPSLIGTIANAIVENGLLRHPPA